MQTKAEAIAMLNEEFRRWEAVIGRHQADMVDPSAQESLKETLIHLWAWQQHSIAYLEAAIADKAPVSPPWPVEMTVDDEGDVDVVNAWVAETYFGKPWAVAYQDWQTGFLTFIALTERLSEPDLLDGKKYPWREGWPLMASLEGSYEHHHEHLEPYLNASPAGD